MMYSSTKIMPRLMGSAMLLLATGCASDRTGPAERGNIKFIIAEENADYIQHVQTVLDDEDATTVKGHVRRGVVGHIPHLYQGHIDLFIENEFGAVIETGVVRLKSKQVYFTYHLTSKPFKAGVIKVAYFKTSHSRHRKF